MTGAGRVASPRGGRAGPDLAPIRGRARDFVLRGTSALLLAALSLSLGACAVVPQNRRAHFAEPMLDRPDEPLDRHRQRKLYTTREAAAGGDGKPAGGGCSCQ